MFIKGCYYTHIFLTMYYFKNIFFAKMTKHLLREIKKVDCTQRMEYKHPSVIS